MGPGNEAKPEPTTPKGSLFPRSPSSFLPLGVWPSVLPTESALQVTESVLQATESVLQATESVLQAMESVLQAME